MRIDAAGNIGVALAPSAWNSSYRALNIQTASLASAASSSEFYVSANAFLNSASAWVYVASSHATQYRQASGIHSWHNAASGTAGNNITFTQAMTLNASGNLGVGLTNPTFRLQASDANLVAAFGLTNGSYLFRELGGAFANNTLELNIRPNSGKSGYLTFTEDGVADRWSVGIANGSTALRFISGGPAGTERMSIDGNGNVVVNTAAIATNATNGFLYVPSCAGTPTGTPTAYAGRVPIVVDTTNNKLYFYSGGTWRDAGP
jgi:hypothetical protein